MTRRLSRSHLLGLGLASVGLALLLLSAALPARAQQALRGSWLLEVAQRYQAWGRVDDELRWAPTLCRMPLRSAVRISRASAGSHARKVYFVYASDRMAYLATTRAGREPPRGLTVVKEAFHPRTLESEPEDYRSTHDGQGRRIGAGAPRGLYVLRYLGEGAPETVAGWTFGTVDPEGQVTASGAIGSCIGCHREARRGLFGLDP